MAVSIAAVRWLTAGLLFCQSFAWGGAPPPVAESYHVPSEELTALMSAPELPEATISPTRQWLLLTYKPAAPTLSELRRTRITVGGWTIDPALSSATSVEVLGTKLVAVDLRSGERWNVTSGGERLSLPVWSRDGTRFLFARAATNGFELMVGDLMSWRLTSVPTNGRVRVRGERTPCVWLAVSTRAICHFVPDATRLTASMEPPIGPMIEESEEHGSRMPLRADRLVTAYDKLLYEEYLGTQASIVDVVSGERKNLGGPAVYDYIDPSPEDRYVLSVRVARPYPTDRSSAYFPRVYEVHDLARGTTQVLHERPAGAWGSLLHGWAPEGKRRYAWVPKPPARLVYIEALDAGNPGNAVSHRDRLMLLDPPFSGKGTEIVRTAGRMTAVPESRRFTNDFEFASLAWLPDGSIWLDDVDYAEHRRRIWRVSLQGHRPASLLLDYNYQDPAKLPGAPMLRGGTEHSNPVIEADGAWVYLVGDMSSTAGTNYFLNRFNLRSRTRERLFETGAGRLEEVVHMVDSSSALTRSESATEPPNYYVKHLRTAGERRLTDFTRAASVPAIEARLVRYNRADGLPLSALLLLPPGRAKGALIWAYPRYFPDKSSASRVRGHSARYIWDTDDRLRLAVTSLVLHGYAVLWEAGMPIVRADETDTSSVQQAIENARAAVQFLVASDISKPDTIAIGGHSFGAALAATLLAQTDMFAAGVAISGVYNFTQSPMGFATEPRTLWEAPAAYQEFSALFHADHIKAPLLFIHGDEDQNSLAPSSESYRMYRSLVGLGQKARLVLLPYEGHVPAAKESIGHIAWEMRSWLDRNLDKASAEARSTRVVTQ